MMLPLSLTAEVRVFRMLWALLVTYGLLAIRDVALQLDDLFS